MMDVTEDMESMILNTAEANKVSKKKKENK